MRIRQFNVVLAVVAALSTVLLGNPQTAAAQAASPTPTTPAGASGPVAIVGEAGSANFYASPDTYPEPTVALIDASPVIGRQPVFVSDQAQIMGTFDTGMFPLPGKFTINLPTKPTGASLDLDNNGKKDAGVQVYRLVVSSNLTGDSYLQQLEQTDMTSYVTDLTSGEITEGALLVYAADGKQRFPTGSGKDKKWFTADDPAGPIPQGYSVVRLGADGKVTLDRTAQATMNTVERAEVASPDFSKQGILESFNSLIDTLKERYAYTDLRKLDWEQIRAKYLPEVKKADTAKDLGAYYVVLGDLALSIRDVHVAATAGTNAAGVDADRLHIQEQLAPFSGNLGAATMAASDAAGPAKGPVARVVVTSVGKRTPAEKAGWVPGTEIVTIDGKPATSRYSVIPLLGATGTEEAARIAQAEYMLNFPKDQKVSVGYRLPDATKILTATLTAGAFEVGYQPNATSAEYKTPITYQQFPKYSLVRWGDFVTNEATKIVVLEEALGAATRNPDGSVILDLRGNSGGSAELYLIMASYFFNKDNPMPVNLFDWYYYDAAAGGLVKEHAVDYKISAPKPELAYTGPLMILVDEKCASACEYFSQHLQKLGRATVVGQYATEGAGGPVDEIKMPEGMKFRYTYGQTKFAGTDEFNLEAKGVVPDIRVPVSVESEQAKLAGKDPVLEAAVAEIDRQAEEKVAGLYAQPWQWASYSGPDGEVKVEKPESYTLTFSDVQAGEIKIKADCNNAAGFYMVQGNLINMILEPSTPAACASGSRSEQFLKLIGAARGAQYVVADGKLQVTLTDGSTLSFAPAK
jgi:C-terminal processing protease CtpA/Prc